VATAGDWRARAACRDYPQLRWIPNDGQRAKPDPKCLEICATCPVREECLADYLGDPYFISADGTRRRIYGVFGGVYHEYHGNRGGGHPPAPCGTPAGYQRHRRQTPKGEPVECEECNRAHRLDTAQRKEAAR